MEDSYGAGELSLTGADAVAQLERADEVESQLKGVDKGGSQLKGHDDARSQLTAAQRARTERNRLRARALQDARLVCPHPASGASAAVDGGGGFLVEEPAGPPRASVPHAPVVHRAEQPRCERCARPFPQSYLLDTFDLSVCDECRDDDDADALVTRTEAKAGYLLQDCDLDARPPPLRCVRRRNPHSARYGDMRLYLRAQVEARALEVWGGAAGLAAERARRSEARSRAAHTRAHRRLRALRLDVRSGLYRSARRDHRHDFGPERHDAAADVYERVCLTCGHAETYEKM